MQAVVEPAMAEGGPRAAVDAFMAIPAGNPRWEQMVTPALRDRMLGNGETLTVRAALWKAKPFLAFDPWKPR